MFYEIKKLTNGYMDEKVYEKIYQYALLVPSGSIVDIGPAQGASTICFGLAAKKNKGIEHIYSIDKFYLSAALSDFNSIEKNVNKLKQNLEVYKCEKSISIIEAGKEPQELFNKKLSLLFIDADGALDRDFFKYYNNLVSNGIIIIDDCQKTINIQTISRNLKFQFQYQVTNYLKWIEISDIEDYTPLGKQYTTYKFVEYFINNNFINVIEEINGTIFAIKSETSKKLNQQHISELKSIRKDIVKLYNQSRESIRSIYETLKEPLLDFAKQIEIQNVILYESSFYAAKFRYQFNKIYEWHSDKNRYLIDDYKIQTIQEDKISDIFRKLAENIVIERQLNKERGNSLEKYLYKNNFKKIVYIPLFHNRILLGFMIIFEERNCDIKICEKKQEKLSESFFEAKRLSDSYIEEMIHNI